ncbi:Hypothetical protein DEACI_2181 [Acididesulfobacillus acetoxydans]|uniref:Uncharacterized protein n=1 Tax=Acididesulfobacillus acetoxydans TaxID=1561005 RepID=A0A8S0WNX2_9FIRM|nr:hypothetical protein [Acididesulfobacillus acetoxydans]CAA7601514.1 Hypothetical protein DEACI_2181 [Acididesulfobacillus acetoxydans]CEJ07001.1 Hypothetical protein DEACI_1455 [Acididesulfobacillus acetoxydans]
MKPVYIRTDYPSGRSHLLLKVLDSPDPELNHFLLVLSRKGMLWVDVFWAYDAEAEHYSHTVAEQEFWHTFREWRLGGISLGNNETVAQFLSHKRLFARQAGAACPFQNRNPGPLGQI